MAGLVKGKKIIRKERFITKESQKTSKKDILKKIKLAIESVWNPQVNNIGLGIAGTTDPKKGIFFQGANFPPTFRNIDFKRELKHFQVPIAIDNDVHCFTLGEAFYGQGQEYKNVFGITLGTGVGGSLVIDKQIYRGRDNAVGEIGHTIISLEEDKTINDLNLSGRLESLASGTGLKRLINQYYKKPFPSEDLERLALRGDKKAIKIIDLAGRAFAIGCANIVLTLNPDIIIVGGGLSRLEGLWRVLHRDFRHLIPYQKLRSTKITKSILLHDATILGAAKLLRG
ncbi:ROK family protein [Patescibacteria group bacterium]|nr:ROK family protein [Patescibacteria group bacterium]MBU1029386.1 ROK family protein [Patescibacteria group bacterium]